MKRPSITKEIILQAAQKVVSNLRINNNDEAVQDIVLHYRYSMDGYELAKRLDDYAYWDIDVQTVDELDSMDGLVRDLHKQECLKWVAENNIQPPHPNGTKITKGVIHDVYEHDAAMYRVKENGCTEEGRHLLVKFEDAVPA